MCGCLQGEIVRQLKSDNRPKLEIAEAVALLKERKKALEKREKELAPKETLFDRAGLEGLTKRRFFYAPAFSIYGGETMHHGYGQTMGNISGRSNQSHRCS